MGVGCVCTIKAIQAAAAVNFNPVQHSVSVHHFHLLTLAKATHLPECAAPAH